MPAMDYSTIRISILNSLKFHKEYDKAMKSTFIFICELYLLWQLIIYGIARSTSLPTSIVGFVLLTCTYVTLRIYRKNAVELEKHGEIILSSHTNEFDNENLKKFGQVAEKYDIGRKSIFAMNVISSLYVLIFSIATLIMHL